MKTFVFYFLIFNNTFSITLQSENSFSEFADENEQQILDANPENNHQSQNIPQELLGIVQQEPETNSCNLNEDLFNNAVVRAIDNFCIDERESLVKSSRINMYLEIVNRNANDIFNNCQVQQNDKEIILTKTNDYEIIHDLLDELLEAQNDRQENINNSEITPKKSRIS
jgi:predicted transcriptional regulator